MFRSVLARLISALIDPNWTPFQSLVQNSVAQCHFIFSQLNSHKHISIIQFQLQYNLKFDVLIFPHRCRRSRLVVAIVVVVYLSKMDARQKKSMQNVNNEARKKRKEHSKTDIMMSDQQATINKQSIPKKFVCTKWFTNREIFPSCMCAGAFTAKPIQSACTFHAHTLHTNNP